VTGARAGVLIVDDATDLRLVVRETLARSSDFVVVGEAADGAEAVAVAAEAQPDLILLDLDMPGVGGLAALPRLRAAAPHAHVIILSGLPRDGHEAQARSAGAVGYLEKGIPARRLVDELTAVAGLLDTVDGVLAERRATLDEDPGAPGAARRFVGETLRRWDCADALGTISLLVSELVTNAILHARSMPEIAVVLGRDHIRVEVADTSDVLPVARVVGPHDTSGRGLAIIEELATTWGVTPVDGPGKVVWFEVPRLDDPGAEATIR
jgi:DNA-binding NarL/FixJ family response regulator